MGPVVQADDGVHLHFPGGFLQGFPDRRRRQRFMLVQVTGRLVVDQFLAVGVFLHDQEPSLPFDDGSDGQARVPVHNGLLTALGLARVNAPRRSPSLKPRA